MKKYHKVWTIFRTFNDKYGLDVNEKIKSFNKEVEDFLDSGYTCIGSGMNNNRIYAVMSKLIITKKED